MDLRVIKTHKAIREAFIQLLSEEQYENITIQDILNSSLVNRATFYKYYASKDDLAGKMIEDFKIEVNKVLEDRLTADVRLLQIIMDNHVQNMFKLRKEILALWKIRTKQHNLYQDMFSMMKQNFLALSKRYSVNPALADSLDYQATMMATVFMASLKYFYERDMPIPNDLTNQWQSMIDIVKI